MSALPRCGLLQRQVSRAPDLDSSLHGLTERPVPYCVYLSLFGNKKSGLLMSSVPNPEFLRRAIALATENVTGGKGGPFGAVIARNGQIVGEGANSVTATNDPTAHGEVNAIRAACRALGTYTLVGCELYTSCEPCPMCLAAAHWARLEAVYFGAS